MFLGAAALLAWGRLRALDTRAIVPEREMEILRRIPFMQALNPLVLERLASRLIPVAASYGEEVIRQGDPGHRFYAIEEGKVRVSVHGGMSPSSDRACITARSRYCGMSSEPQA